MGGARGARRCTYRGGFALSGGARAARRPDRAGSGVAAARRLGRGAPHAGRDRRGRTRAAERARRARSSQPLPRPAGTALGERDRGRVGAAFEASERLRAREMLELLARGRITAPLDTAQDLVTREQDLRRRIGELTHDLAQSDATDETLRGSEVAVNAGTTRESLLRAQETYADLLLEARERAPRHAALVAPDVVSWQSVARRLTPEGAFIEYLVSDSATLVFVVTTDTVAALDVGMRRQELARLVEFTRGVLTLR